jgi:hypothetical protein
MTNAREDHRSPERRARDEQIAAEPQLPPLALPPDAVASPVEVHLGSRLRRPVAVTGVVENGLVRPLDPAIKLPEHSRVIIVASEAT